MDANRKLGAIRRWEEWRDFFAISTTKPGHFKNDYLRDLDLLIEYITHLRNQLEMSTQPRIFHLPSILVGAGISLVLFGAGLLGIAYFVG